jgi:DNA polymerase-3 subunit delta
MGFDEVEKDWKNGKSKPIYVFFGEEEFLRSELTHAAPDIFLPEEGTRAFNYDLLYGSETSLRDVVSMASGYPVMADRRLIIVRDAEKILKTKAASSAPAKRKSKSDKSLEDPLIGYLKNPSPETTLIFDMLKMGPRNQSPFKELAEYATLVEFPAMKEAAVISWLVARTKKMGKTLSESSARLMVAHLGTSLRIHSNELEKLVTFTGGSKQITEEDVERVVGVSREFNIFELQKAIGSGARKTAIDIALQIIGHDKDQRQYLLVMLARYMEQLMIANEMMAKRESEKAIAEALELRGGAAYFVKDYMSSARRYTRARLDNAMQAFVRAEIATRKSKVDDALLFETLLIDLVPIASS